MSNKLRVFRRTKDVPLPKRMTANSAGLDVYAECDTTLPVNKVVLIETGLIIEPPKGTHIKLFIRSSLAVKKNVTLINNVGIIDEDYCGESDFLKVAVFRHGQDDEDDIVLSKGERIAQLIFERTDFPQLEWDEQENRAFAGTSRGGFGSTGKR
jgi:dUTP pyrophosphatase